MEVRADIAVQPARRIQIGKGIMPPIVVRLDGNCIDENHYVFAMPVLVGATTNLPENALVGGALTVTSETPPSLGCTAVFVIPNLSISRAGKYRLRVDIYRVSYDDPNGATLLAQLPTNRITVREEKCPPHCPSKFKPLRITR